MDLEINLEEFTPMHCMACNCLMGGHEDDVLCDDCRGSLTKDTWCDGFDYAEYIEDEM